MITPSVFGAEQHVCKRSTLAVLTSRHGGKHMWQLYFATDLHRVRPWVNDINYDNGNEINKVHLLNLLQVSFKYMFWTKYMFWSMFSLLVIEGIFFRTSIWNTKNIFGNFFGNETYLYHTCTEEYKPSITSKHTWKHTWKHTLKHTCKVTTCTFISVVIAI